jgi:hypothetical protein
LGHSGFKPPRATTIRIDRPLELIAMADTLNSEVEQRRLERDAYFEARGDLVEKLAEQYRSFDNAILTLAAGALGLSLTFITDIVPTIRECTGWLLYGGWTAFVSSLLITLCSFQMSAAAIRRQIAIMDAEQQGDSSRDSRNCAVKWTAFLNWATLLLFIAGAALLTVFVALNAYHP